MSLYRISPQDARRALALGALAAKAKKARLEAELADATSEQARLAAEGEAALAEVEAFARHAYIQTAEGQIVSFAQVGWPWQYRLLAIWAREKLCVVLKARQLGVSWLAAMFALWRAIRRPGQAVLLISRNQADAEKLLDKVAFLYAHLPPWKPAAIVNVRSIRFPDLGSEIEALPATENVGRSRTAALVILDEHAHQPRARQILAAVKAVAEKGQIISISSANGQGALHSQIYLAAKAGTNGWHHVFIPAQAHPDRQEPGWRERERAALEQLSDAAFAQEYPESDIEAIATTGRPVFRPEDLVRQPVEIGTVGPPGLTLYRTPEAGKIYLVGADVGEGLATSDWSSATVLERDSGEQVAQLRGRWAPDVYAAKLDGLARLFGRHADAHNRTPVIVGVERNNHGHAVLLKLRELHDATAPYAIFRARDGRLGWLTSSASRPILIDQLEAALRTGELVLHDAGTVDQFGTFAWSDDGHPEGQEGYSDDDVMAAGIAWQIHWRAFVRVLGVRPGQLMSG